MSEVLMYIGLGCVVSGTLRVLKILCAYNVMLEKNKSSLAKHRGTINNKFVDQPITFSNINDNCDLEKDYAKLVLENTLLKEKLNQKETLKGKGKYSKLAEELLNGN